jgi:hypothetical protein
MTQRFNIPPEWLSPAEGGPQGPQLGPEGVPEIPPWVLQGFVAGTDANTPPPGGIPGLTGPFPGGSPGIIQPVPVPPAGLPVIPGFGGPGIPGLIQPSDPNADLGGGIPGLTAPAVPPGVIPGIPGGIPGMFQPVPANPPAIPPGIPAIPGLTGPFGGVPGVIQPVPVNPASPVGQLLFPYQPQEGEKALATFDGGPKGAPDVVLTAEAFRQGTMTALVHAEELGAKMGWSALNPDGSPVVGSAASKADPKIPEGAAYLAVQSAVHDALAASAQVDPSTPTTVGIAPGVAVVLIVVAVAALAAGAYVLAEKVRADADSLARVKRAALAADLVRQGHPVPPGLVAPEPPPGSGPSFSLGGGIGLGLGLAAAAGIGLVVLARK